MELIFYEKMTQDSMTTVNANPLDIPFGDGYSQVVHRGFNAQRREVQGVIELPRTDASMLIAQLDLAGGVESLEFPDLVTKEWYAWTCSEYSVDNSRGGHWQVIRMTFVRRYRIVEHVVNAGAT